MNERREVERAGQALHGLDDDGCRARVDGGRKRRGVVARYERDVERRARKAVPRLRRAVGDGARGCGPAVEAVLHRDDFRASRNLQREPQRILVGLGAAVDEEDASQARRAERCELFRSFVADLERQCVGLEHELAARACERLAQVAVAVAERGDGMTAIQIEDAAPGRVLEIHTGAAHGRERQHRIDFVEMRADGGDLVCRYVHHSHPAAGAAKPISSGNPRSLFAHCRLPPAAPFSKLSVTEQTTIVSPWTTACSAA